MRLGLCKFYKVDSLAVATRMSQRDSGTVKMMGHKDTQDQCMAEKRSGIRVATKTSRQNSMTFP